MLSRGQRLSRAAFAALRGHTYHNEYFSLRASKTKETGRFSVVVSKKVAKTSVERHHIRRQVYAILTDMLPTLPQELSGIVFAKAKVRDCSYEDMKESLEGLFRQATTP